MVESAEQVVRVAYIGAQITLATTIQELQEMMVLTVC